MVPRVALLNIGRPCPWLKAPSFGLLYIAAYLQKDLGIRPEDIVFADQPAGDDVIEVLRGRDWDILGVSSLSVTARELNQLAPMIRTRWPERCMVLGGVHVSAVPDVALRQSRIPFGVIGDGERSFARIVAGLARSSRE